MFSVVFRTVAFATEPVANASLWKRTLWTFDLHRLWFLVLFIPDTFSWLDTKCYGLTFFYTQQRQQFYGLLSGTTRVSRYQKKHSPAHHPDHHPIFISFFHLPRSIASSSFKLRGWQSFCTTSFHVLVGLPLGLEPSTSYSIHFLTDWLSTLVYNMMGMTSVLHGFICDSWAETCFYNKALMVLSILIFFGYYCKLAVFSLYWRCCFSDTVLSRECAKVTVAPCCFVV